MNFEIEEVNSSIEQLLITRLIVSEKFCINVVPHLDSILLKTNISRTICGWVSDYYKEYQTCPGKNIQSIFDENKNQINEEEADLIQETLENISEKYVQDDHFNEDYAINSCLNYLKKQKIHYLKEDIEGALEAGQIKDAEEAIEKYNSIKRINISRTDVLKDSKSISSAMNIEEEKLFKFPGSLGELTRYFNAGDLIAFAAPAKKGKTWWMIESCSKSLLAGLNTVFISLEMPKSQVLRRIYQNLCCGRILREDETAQETNIPKFGFTGAKYVIKQIRRIQKILTTSIVKKKMLSISKMARGGGLKLICAPSKSIDVRGIKEQLDNLVTYEGFVPNVVVIDYADIIAPTKGLRDQRSQIDDVWSSLRGLAQELNCLIITGTHTNRNTFNRDSDVADVTEDIRKVNHVSMMIALNQSPEEKKIGVMRVKVVADRHEGFHTDNEVVVLQALDIGKPYLDSKWKREVIIKDEEE